MAEASPTGDAGTPPPPPPGSPQELEAFRRLQARLPGLFRDVFADPGAPRTVVVVPSLSLDQQVMARIAGVHHYEERMLCLLLLLRLPRTRLVYVTSQPIAGPIVDYYLHLLPGVPHRHAGGRLTLLACHDASPQPLSAKILARPRLLGRLREAVGDPATAHMTCFTVSALERTLQLRCGSGRRSTAETRTCSGPRGWVGVAKSGRAAVRHLSPRRSACLGGLATKRFFGCKAFLDLCDVSVAEHRMSQWDRKSLPESLFYRAAPSSVVRSDGGGRCGRRKIVSGTRMMADATRAT